MTATINASTSGGGGIIQTADSSGILALQTGGTTAVTIDGSQNVGVGTASLLSRLTVKASGGTYATGALALVASSSGTSYITNAGGKLYFSNDGSTDQLVLDASGNLGIGNTNPASFFSTSTKLVVGSGVGNNGMTIYSGAGVGDISFADGTTDPAFYSGLIRYSHTNDSLSFYTDSNERARIDSSGNLLVGTTSLTAYGKVSVAFNGSSYNGASYNDTNNTTGAGFIYFLVGGTTIGSITRVGSGSTISYATSSDYRLKENIASMTGALDVVQRLKPVTYTWKADGSDGQGFIAHELAEVCPDAVVGEKDAVNEDGSIKSQGIDTSFLVATLTAAIQEQQAIITTLTERISALEAK